MCKARHGRQEVCDKWLCLYGLHVLLPVRVTDYLPVLRTLCVPLCSLYAGNGWVNVIICALITVGCA